MLYASDRKFSETFIGDFTFDIVRDRTRFPLFLTRNIMRVLDHHAKGKRPDFPSSAVATQNGALRRTSLVDRAHPPPRSTRLRDQLVEKFHQEGAEIIFDIRSIRRKLNYRENLEERPQKRAKREAVKCRCYFAVWDNREGHRHLEPILKRSEDCLVTPADTASDAHAVELDLQSPFRIPAKEFNVPILNKNGETIRWAMGDKYLLEVKIIPCNTSGLWPPIPILSKSEESLARGLLKREDLAFTEGMLISNYTNLPHAPPFGVPLNVAFDQGGRTFKTKYGLEVHAEWTYPHVYEARLKQQEAIEAKRIEEEEKTDPLCRSIDGGRTSKIRASRLATLVEKLPVKSDVRVSYIFDIETRISVSRESRTISLEGFNCPVCHNREFLNLKRLQFHFSNNHDKYKFSIESEEQDLQTKNLRCLVFRVEAAEIVRPRAADHITDERVFSWQRPERPFDIHDYVSGEHSWVGAPPRRRTAATAAQHQPPQVATLSTSIQAAGLTGRKSLFRSSTEVPQIPLPNRKKFRVPVAKTTKKTTFYRSVSHRAMDTGEILSETDDDVDDQWLIKRQQDSIADTEGLTEVEKRFRQKWNAHVLSEGCPSARYISDSLIRFVRGNVVWLAGSDEDVGMFVQFQQLTSVLMERGMIDAKVLRDCFQVIRDGKDVREKQTSEFTADVPGQLVKAATRAVDDPSGAQELNPHEKPLQYQEGLAGRENNASEGTEAASHQMCNESNHAGASHRGQKMATSTPDPGSQPRESQQTPMSTEAERTHHVTATDFCSVCNTHIRRPKRNALTCSTSVRLVQSSLCVPSASPAPPLRPWEL